MNPISALKEIQRIKANGIPRTVFWAIISYCNAVCTTCSFYRVPKNGWKYVGIEDAKKAVDILFDSNFRMASITGGEPLMNPDVLDICDYLHKKGFVITYLPTNGLLVTREIARRLKDANVRLVGISIDLDDGNGMGLTRKIPKLKKVVMNSREILEGAGLKTYAGILMTKRTLDIPRILQYVTDLGFDKVIFSYPQLVQKSTYKASAELEELTLSIGELEKAVGDIKAAKSDFDGWIHNPAVSLDELVRFYKNEPRTFKCHGGRKLFYLDWNLDVYRCFTLPKKYGNLLEMGKIEEYEEELCDMCCQQAFRDHDPFYHLASTLSEAKRLAAKGNVISSARLLSKKENRTALGAVTEFLTGGFA